MIFFQISAMRLPVSSLNVRECLIFYYWKKKSRRKSGTFLSCSSSSSFCLLVIFLCCLISSISIRSVSCQHGEEVGIIQEDGELGPDGRHPLQPQQSPENRWSQSNARARLLASLPRQPRHRGKSIIC